MDGFDVRADLTVAEPARAALVFVHGFTGHPVRTWRSFPEAIERDGDDEWHAADVFYLGYDSVAEEIGRTANRLVRFLRRILPTLPIEFEQTGAPRHDHPPPLLRPPGQAVYESLGLVGHSQGGVVVRKAVLDVVQLAAPPGSAAADALIRDARVRLFAPAIGGARPAGLKGMLLHAPMLGSLARVALGRSPSYAELQQGSSVLTILRQQSEDAATRGAAADALEAAIAWADDDQVVSGWTGYRQDRYQVPLDRTDHGSVCKPRIGFRDPLTFVEFGDV